MLGFASSIATYIQVPSLLCSNDAKVLALRFSTFTDTTTHSRFDLMRCTQSAISLFNAYCIAYTVMQAKTAPGTTYTALYGAQRFSISMSAFKTCFDQLFPD